MSVARFVPPILAVALGGCASTLSGVGGSERYACKAPEGALCTSVSGVYANSIHAIPLSSKPVEKKPEADAPVAYDESPIAPSKRPDMPSASIRSNPRVLRVWIAPWEDADGDLHEEAFVHVVVNNGRWLVEHVRPAARPRVESVAPPTSPSQNQPAAKASSESTQVPQLPPTPPAR